MRFGLGRATELARVSAITTPVIGASDRVVAVARMDLAGLTADRDAGSDFAGDQALCVAEREGRVETRPRTTAGGRVRLRTADGHNERDHCAHRIHEPSVPGLG